MSAEKLDAVIALLKKTISGKKMYADHLATSGQARDESGITLEFLKINISELERILGDLEEARKEIV